MHGVTTLLITEGGEMGEYMTNDEDCMVVAEEAIPECMERMAGTEDVGDRTKMEICLKEVSLKTFFFLCTNFHASGKSRSCRVWGSRTRLYCSGVYVPRIPC